MSGFWEMAEAERERERAEADALWEGSWAVEDEEHSGLTFVQYNGFHGGDSRAEPTGDWHDGDPTRTSREWQPQFEARDDHSLVDTRTGEIIERPEPVWESLLTQPEVEEIYDPEYGTEEEPYVAEVHGQGFTATVAEFTDTSGLIYVLHSEQTAPAADDNPDQAWAQEAEADQAARELVAELEESLQDRLMEGDEHVVMGHLMESKPEDRLGAYLDYELENEMERIADDDDDDEEW